MAAPAFHYATIQEYERLEAVSETKNEWFDGEIVAMSGGSPSHYRIQQNLAVALGNALRGGLCEPFGSDTRVRSTQMLAYPDASIVCGKADFNPSEPIGTLLNPSVIFEILSPSTERYDRGLKFQQYQEIASFNDYVLIAQDEMRVEHYRRFGNEQWLLTTNKGPQAILSLPDQNLRIPVADLYERVEFPPPATPDDVEPQG